VSHVSGQTEDADSAQAASCIFGRRESHKQSKTSSLNSNSPSVSSQLSRHLSQVSAQISLAPLGWSASQYMSCMPGRAANHTHGSRLSVSAT
jgi:hypothetical protein